MTDIPKMETFTVRISGTGLARNGMDAIKRRSSLYDAKAAISAFHDALLAVVTGKITPDQAREFFWRDDLDQARMFGDVLNFEEKVDNNRSET